MYICIYIYIYIYIHRSGPRLPLSPGLTAMATEPLLAVVKVPGIHGRGHGAGGCRADLLQGLPRQVSRMLRQASLLLPWLLCLLGSWSGGLQMEPGFGWLWDLELSPVLLPALGAVAMVASSALGVVTMVSQQRPAGVRADLGPMLAALALLLWHLGVSRQPGPTERWCVAVVTRAASTERPLGLRALDRSAAIGLFLLDDVLRAVLRFVAGTPSEAWPFALADRTCHSLWSSDEEWWANTYIYIYIYTHVLYVIISLSPSLSLSIYIYIYICMYEYVYISLSTYIHIYI